jgi:hypothetical protein
VTDETREPLQKLAEYRSAGQSPKRADPVGRRAALDLTTAVLQRVRHRCPSSDPVGPLNGKSFDAPRSKEMADENAVATFA